MNEVEKYINKQAAPQRERLKKLRKLISKAAPLAEEGMSYGAPAFKFNGALVLYAAFKEHIGLYPEPETIKAFEKELAGYSTSKGAIRFRLDEAMPYALIEKIVKHKYRKLKL